MMITNPKKGLVAFILDCTRWSLSGGVAYNIYLAILLVMMGAGVYAYGQQFQEGLIITGMSNIVSWGLYISNFTFFVGVAAAAVMLILPAYVYKDKDFHEVVIIGEGVAVGALVMCLLFITVDMGGPLKVWHMIPGIGLFNWPSSILTWDVLVLNGYLALNTLVPLYILYCNYHEPGTGGLEISALCLPVHLLGCFHSHGHRLSLPGTCRHDHSGTTRCSAPDFWLRPLPPVRR